MTTGCSLPFTFDGQLYYACLVNNSAHSCILWCQTTDLNLAACTTEISGRHSHNVVGYLMLLLFKLVVDVSGQLIPDSNETLLTTYQVISQAMQSFRGIS